MMNVIDLLKDIASQKIWIMIRNLFRVLKVHNNKCLPKWDLLSKQITSKTQLSEIVKASRAKIGRGQVWWTQIEMTSFLIALRIPMLERCKKALHHYPHSKKDEMSTA